MSVNSWPDRRDLLEAGARMWRRRSLGLLGALAASALALAPSVQALQREQPLPSFSAKDLNGNEHESGELRGHRTLVVVMTDRDGGDAMQRWFDAADARLGKGHYASTALISLRLPFFVSEGAARGRAKQRVPQEFWDATWLDRNGRMAKTLGLPQSREPFVFVVDAQGHVVAQAQGPADSPEATHIWSALSNR